MVDYTCTICGKDVSGVLVERKIRCPYCSSKILSKKQNRISDVIKAR